MGIGDWVLEIGDLSYSSFSPRLRVSVSPRPRVPPSPHHPTSPSSHHLITLSTD
ncbi:hypothetical protein [Trichormus sp. NMC-1]|uniref:hypothetical protein n=1 Tax=Trichormus sp. NMC-1 TaxID=1853259 RepID=UPI0015A60EC2|nr:hypothetical protein [Trichormus sp. NMC-1]